MPSQIQELQNTTVKILSHPTWDIVVIFALVAIGFFYGLVSGRRKAASGIIYTYVALAVFSALPIDRLVALFTTKEIFFVKIGAFLILFILLTILLGIKRGRNFASAGSWWQIFLLSFVQAGLLIHIVFSFVPADKVKLLAPLTRNFFANPALHVWWITVPIVILIFIRWLEVRDEW